MTSELNQLNEKIQRNTAARERAERTRREEAKQKRVDAALRACRIPVVLTAATWIAAVAGLASTVLATGLTVPTVCWICFQAGTVR